MGIPTLGAATPRPLPHSLLVRETPTEKNNLTPGRRKNCAFMRLFGWGVIYGCDIRRNVSKEGQSGEGGRSHNRAGHSVYGQYCSRFKQSKAKTPIFKPHLQNVSSHPFLMNGLFRNMSESKSVSRIFAVVESSYILARSSPGCHYWSIPLQWEQNEPAPLRCPTC